MTSFKQHFAVAAAIGLLSLTLILANVGPAMAEQPIELHQVSMNANFSTEFFNFTIDVPTGKRLIIESASTRVSLPPGQRARATVSGNFSTGVGTQHLSLTFQGTFNGQDIYTTTQPVRLYVNDAGGAFSVVRDSTTGSVFAEVSIAGFLEDEP